MRTQRGFTLMEMLITLAIAALVMGAVMKYLPQIPIFFHRVQVQQQIQSESGNAMETMDHFLRLGIASTVHICSCNDEQCVGGSTPGHDPCVPTADVPANSQIDFVTTDGHWRSFCWGWNPVPPRGPAVANALVMWDIPPTGAPVNPVPSILAHNVTNVQFGLADPLNNSLVTISMQIDAPLDASGDRNRVSTVSIPPRTIRMLTTQ